ncbi:hypothetical protein FGG08_001577 [Glutinoglossum americanum]|uniref:RING-type domain-containing protein n=1 Tax=Glutinoglossum americanum TaxID=1670608 RepID=A0A9P8I6T0_9PEZI|nr:hypothetical protein FGG08_001577 [Glutinoglossum americanum]
MKRSDTPSSVLSPTMGQSASSQREESSGRDHRRLSQIILERTWLHRQTVPTVDHESVVEHSEIPQSVLSPTMGQNSSSQREEPFERDHRRFSQFVLEHTHSHRLTAPEGDFRRHTLYNPLSSRPPRGQGHIQTDPVSALGQEPPSLSGSSDENGIGVGIDGLLARQSTTVDHTMSGVGEADAVQSEDANGDIRMSDVPAQTSTEHSRYRRRASYLSRVGARLMPRPNSSNFAGEHQETGPDEHSRLTHILRRNQRREHRDTHSRSSMLHPTSSRGSPSPPSRRRNVASISRPIPLPSHNWPSQEGVMLPPLPTFDPVEPPTSAVGPSNSPIPFSTRSSRLSRVRNSVSMALPALFHSTRTNESSITNISAPRRPSRVAFSEDSNPYLPRPTTPNLEIYDTPLASPIFSPTHRSDGIRPALDPGDITPPRMREERRLPSLLDEDEDEDGRTRLRPGEDQAAMLSRLLSVAAAATAASLVGGTEQAILEAQDVAGGNGDGSFEGFLQNLRNGRLASALRNGGYETGGGTPNTGSGDGNLAPLNFFRMFRFGNSGANSAQDSGTTTPQDEEQPAQEEEPAQRNAAANGSPGSEGRMVPVIIVGIRSMPPRIFSNRDEGFTSPFLDALSDLPFPIPRGLSREGPGGFLRRTDRSRFAREQRSRRAAMAGAGGTFSNYDNQRHQRTSGSFRQHSDSTPPNEPTLPSVLSESPPGPHPPPSTPAEPGFSTFSSGESTPSRRPSTSAAGGSRHPTALQDDRNATSWEGVPDSTSEDGNLPSSSARNRRLSDSEFIRNRAFGSGSSRRNGIIGGSGTPVDRLDNAQTRSSPGGPSEGPRSWIIYVLGGSYPENHPILTTPSLFTDSPTYEDMLLLSSILGPAKPPVATREEVNSAPGVFIINGTRDSLFAEASNGDRVQIPPGERCLVCLSDYEPKEEIRQLTNCRHLFHRDCIDQGVILAHFAGVRV